MTLFILFVAIIALLFLFINLVFAPHNPYQEKDSMFECGFHSFQQSRSPFNIAFFIYALVYLLLDLEILLLFPFAVSEYINNIYGLLITLGFILIITTGFVFELGKGALKIPSKQHTYPIKNQPLIHISYINTKTGGSTLLKKGYLLLTAEIPKPHSFISPPLQGRVFSGSGFFIFIKIIKKHLTIKNLIIGLFALIVMALVKILGIPMYILSIFELENIE
jgi:NADH-ubiquinone oxidoreductase chain 3